MAKLPDRVTHSVLGRYDDDLVKRWRCDDGNNLA